MGNLDERITGQQTLVHVEGQTAEEEVKADLGGDAAVREVVVEVVKQQQSALAVQAEGHRRWEHDRTTIGRRRRLEAGGIRGDGGVFERVGEYTMTDQKYVFISSENERKERAKSSR